MNSPGAAAALVAGELDVAVGRGAPRGAGAEGLVTVPIGADHLVAVVGVAHPFAGSTEIRLEQLAAEHLIMSAPEQEPAIAAHLRGLFGADATALDAATMSRDVHTIIGLAACDVGVGLGPARMRLVTRKDIWFCDVAPRLRLPDLQLSFRAADESPVLAAFLDVVRANCAEVGSRLDDILARREARSIKPASDRD
jgi:DNA-binding transcriptional LysR family regulator